MNKKLYCTFLVVLLFFSILDTLATDFPNEIKLVSGDNYYPYADSSLPDGGWSFSIVKAVFEQLKQPYTIDVLPWKRGLLSTKRNQYHGAFPYVQNSERELDFLYSNPINVIPVRLIVGKHSNISSIDDLLKKKFCLPKGYSFSTNIEKKLKPYHLIIVNAKGSQGCLNQVKKGWSDVTFLNGYYNAAAIEQRYGSKEYFVILPEVIDTVTLHLIVSKTSPQAKQLITVFNQSLSELKHIGIKARIDEQYIKWLTTNKNEQL